jgi:lysophospholipase L1-like esterase
LSRVRRIVREEATVAHPRLGFRFSTARSSRRRVLAAGAGAAAALATESAGLAASPHGARPADPPGGPARDSIGTWATGPTAVPPSGVTVLQNQTVRQVVHISAGGDQVRVRLTNEFGEVPLVVGESHLALRAPDGAGTDITPATDRVLKFGGRTSVTVPAGAPVLSDPVALRLPAAADLVVSIYLPEPTRVTTVHGFSFQENVVAAGNVTAARSVTPTTTVTQWYFLSGVSVRPSGPAAASVVAFGDSITDGAFTENNANHRYPDVLAERLRAAPGFPDRGVLNLGIAGNRLLFDPNPPPGSDAEAFAALFGPSGLGRFDRDVLSQPGVGFVIVLLGINDLGHPGAIAPIEETVSSADLIGGHRQLIARARQAGLKIFGGTIMPVKGIDDFFTEENERKRQEVNHWIRTSQEYDGVVDFDAATRDPADPLRLRPEFDSGDHLHPNDAGAAAMAAAVPLRFLR